MFKNTRTSTKLLFLGIVFIIATLGLNVLLGALNADSSIQLGDPAPEFSLIDVTGQTFSLVDYRGRVVVVNFMATWCSFCKQQITELETIWEAYEDTTTIISLSTESEDLLRPFLHHYPNATWYWGQDTVNLYLTYRITSLPVTVIIDPDGNIGFIQRGLTPSTTLSTQIESLLT